jgi:hypothetical protein
MLDTALREGRIDLAEYELRVTVVQAAKTQVDLEPTVAGLPQWPGHREPHLRVSTVERDQALVRLTEALADGRLDAAGYGNAEALLRRAVTYADMDAVVGNLDAKASLAERARVVAQLESAAAQGLLDPAERLSRIAAAEAATTDKQLAALVADLSPVPARRDVQRVSHSEREAVARRLRAAVDEGVLDLIEFDERVRAAYAARLGPELSRLVADLPEPPPGTELAEPTTGRPLSRRDTGRWLAIGGTAITAVLVAGATTAGQPFLAAGILTAWVATACVVATAWHAREHRRRSSKAGSGVDRGLAATKPVQPLPVSAMHTLRLYGHARGVEAVSCLVLPDGTPVAITGSRDGTAKVWDLRDGSELHTLSGHTSDVVGVAGMVLPDRTPVAVGIGRHGAALVWNLHDGSLRGPLEEPWIEEPRAVACLSLPDGRPVAVVAGTSSRTSPIGLWDLRNGSLLRRLGARHHYITAMAAMALPDGTPIAVLVEGRTAAVRSLENYTLRMRLTGHTDHINAIACSVLPDGTPVAVTASADATARTWDLRPGPLQHLRHTLTGHRHPPTTVACIALPDGTPIAVTTGHGVDGRLWDLRDGLPVGGAASAETVAGLTLPDRSLVVMTGLEADVYTLRR